MTEPPPSEVEAEHFLISFSAAVQQVSQPKKAASEKPVKPPSKPDNPTPRKLTPQRVAVASTSPSPFSSASSQQTPHDPFLRRSTNPWKPPATPTAQPQLKETQSDAKEQPKKLDHDGIEAASQFHAVCAKAVPYRFCDTQSALMHVLRTASITEAGSMLKWTPPSSLLKSVDSWPAFQLYACKTLSKLGDIIHAYPTPIAAAYSASQLVSLSFPTSIEKPFPFISGQPPWTPPLSNSLPSPAILKSDDDINLANKLSSNLETAWDQLLTLRRQYLGEVTSCAPGVLNVKTALFAMAALHPANMDVFAHRFINLMSRSALQARDATPKMRQLSARLRSAGAPNSDGGASKRGGRGGGSAGKTKAKGASNEGVVLHRLPQLVRSMFENDPAELFFLDFLTAVDSAKLYVALVPRLAAALSQSLAVAAAATSNECFTDAVVDARMYAKFLCVAMNGCNWAHSPHSLSGTNEIKSSSRPGLGNNALKWRAPIHAATWMAVLDVEKILQSAVRSEQLLAIVATTAVSVVIMRLACADPVAASSEWFMRCLNTLRDLRVYPNRKDKADEEMITMPLVSAMIGEVLTSDICSEHLSKLYGKKSTLWSVSANDQDDWRALGDIRLIKECCPSLEELRKALISPVETNTTVQKVVARRITPLAKAATTSESGLSKLNGTVSRPLHSKTDGSGVGAPERSVAQDRGVGEKNCGEGVQAALQREFYTRMDGRLRELIGVVLSSKPDSYDTAIDRYTQVATLLYPKAPQTVVAVAAHICADKTGKHKIEGPTTTAQETVGLRRVDEQRAAVEEQLPALSLKEPD